MTDNYLKIERIRQKLVASYNSLPELDRAIPINFSNLSTS
jgi:hypothetical protein